MRYHEGVMRYHGGVFTSRTLKNMGPDLYISAVANEDIHIKINVEYLKRGLEELGGYPGHFLNAFSCWKQIDIVGGIEKKANT